VDEQLLQKIQDLINKQYPYLNSQNPEIHLQPNGDTLLIFTGYAPTTDNHMLPLILRVVVDANGKVKKQTTSR
jgi:hypothetical protein